MVPAKQPNEAVSLEPKQVPTAQQDGGAELERFYDVPIQVNVQLDQKRVTVADVLDLHVDSIVEMNRSAGENVDFDVGRPGDRQRGDRRYRRHRRTSGHRSLVS